MEKTKLEDVIHLYLGAEVVASSGITGRIISMNLYYKLASIEINRLHQTVSKPFDELTPILRRLSSMTEEEAFKVICLHHMNYPPIFIGMDDDGRYFKYRLQYYGRTSKIQYEAMPVQPKSPTAVAYLLSKGFDLFNLIENNLAIEKPISEK